MITIGSVVAGYRIERVLGSGGMGTVYLAQNPELPRRDALKVLSAELSRDPDFRARFVREADVAAGLQHPNIVSIYSRGETEAGQLWIAMQFVDGTDADEALRTGTMTPMRAVHIIGEVAQALDYAHHRKVVHRDVKPANFLLSGHSGAPEQVLLGDFGIARGLDDVGLTATGSIIATMAYAAPEVLAGLPLDGRADLYSLGCSLFRLLTGETPFAGAAANGPAAVMMAHFHYPPPRVTDRAPWLPPTIDSVLTTALAKDPAGRFRSASEFASAAAAALRGQPATFGAPLPAAPPALPQRRRGRRWVIAALAAVVLLGSGTVAALMPARGTQQQAAVPTTSTSTDLTKPSSSPAATVAASALRPLLLPVDQIAKLMGGMHPQVFDAQAVLDLSGPVAEKECIGAYQAAQTLVYDKSGYTGVELQELIDQDDPSKPKIVIQAVISFLTAERAREVLADQVRQWRQCANRTITDKYPGRVPVQVTFGAPGSAANGVHTITSQLAFDPQEHRSNTRALAVRNNVVIDVVVLNPVPGDQAPDIAGLIAQRVGGA